MSDTEQTLSIIKPDAVERNLVEDIKNIFRKIIYTYFIYNNYTYIVTLIKF